MCKLRCIVSSFWFLLIVCTVLFGCRVILSRITGEYRISGDWESVSGQTVSVSGVILDKTKKEDSMTYHLSGGILVYDPEGEDLPIGSRILVQGKANAFSGKRNPGGFDAWEYYRGEKCGGSIYGKQIKVMNRGSLCLKEIRYRIRDFFAERMVRGIGKENGGILAAMVFGEKGSMDPERKELYQRAGIGHLLAVSGFHVGFFGMIIYGFLRKVGASLKVSGICASVILLGYCALCGNPVSAVRATLMFLYQMGSVLTGRIPRPERSLLFAAFCILMQKPLEIRSAGFLLSFGAVIGIFFLYPVLAPKKTTSFVQTGIRGKLSNLRWQAYEGIFVTLAVEMIVLPLTLYFFYEVPVYLLIAGIPAVLLFGIVMGSGVLGCAVCVIFPLAGKVVWMVAGFILELLNGLGRLELFLPFSRWVVGRPGILNIVIYYVILGCAFFYLKRREKRKFFLPAVWVLLLLLFVKIPDHRNLSVVMIDVGQGDCFFMKSKKGTTYLFDGGSSSQKNPERYIIEPFLKSQGISSIDYVFLSHGDADHINGIEAMLKRKEIGVRIRNLVFPDRKVWSDFFWNLAVLAKEQGTRVLTMRAGETLQDGTLSLRCLYPYGEEGEEPGNDSSLTIAVKEGNFKMLMTGDLGVESEQILLKKQQISRYTVLKLGHHGSKNSSCEEWISTIQPKYALISAGKDNRYHHPHDEVITRLKEHHCKILRTDQLGAVRIRTDGQNHIKLGW